MAFNVIFYMISNNPKDMFKNLENPIAIKTGVAPYEPLSELTGKIVLDYDSEIELCNYCTMLGKQYFITDKVITPAKKIEFTVKVDVLATYANQILLCPAVVSRSENVVDAFVVDGQQPAHVFPAQSLLTFNALEYGDYVFLLTAG